MDAHIGGCMDLATGHEDQPYHERQAGVRDAFGNIWYIATYVGGV